MSDSAIIVSSPTNRAVKNPLTVRQQRAGMASLMTGDLPIYTTKAEVHGALALMDGKPWERCLLRAFWEWGPRRGEMLNVRVRDINFPVQLVSMLTLKRRPKPGQRPPIRVLPVSGGLLGEIAHCMRLHHLEDDSRLFSWSESRCHEIVRDALLRAGVSREKCNCRAMRHGFAVNCVLQGMPLPVLQKLMGHASAMTTSIYIQVLGMDVAEFYRRIEF
jgi:integrase